MSSGSIKRFFATMRGTSAIVHFRFDGGAAGGSGMGTADAAEDEPATSSWLAGGGGGGTALRDLRPMLRERALQAELVFLRPFFSSSDAFSRSAAIA